jgi:hypothetical protein
MAVYWVDPYLSATTNGNGTTGTGRTGTYSNPFDIWDVIKANTSSSSSFTVNSVSYTLASNDEFRIKGVSHSDLFDDWGLGYVDSTGAWIPDTALSTAPTNNVISFDSTTTQYWTPLANAPEFIATTNWGTGNGATNAGHTTTSIKLSSTSELETRSFYRGILNRHDSNNKIRLYGMKSDYYVNEQGVIAAGVSDYTSYMSSLRFLNFSLSGVDPIKFTAGWDTETTQNGHSILNIKNSNRIYTYTWKTILDLGRMSIINDYDNAYVYASYYSATANNRTYHFNSLVGGRVYTGLNNVYNGGYNVVAEYKTNWVQAQYVYVYQVSRGTSKSTATDYCIIANETNSPQYYTSGGYPGNRNIGTVIRYLGKEYGAGNSGGGFFSVGSTSYNSAVPNMTVNFLDNSVYFSYFNSSAGHTQLALTDTVPSGEGTVKANGTYGSNLKNANYPTTNNPVFGSPTSSKVQPSWGEGVVSRPDVFVTDANLSGNNWWSQYFGIDKDAANFQGVSLGSLACNGNDYTSTNTDMQGVNPNGDFDALYYCFDDNDYDGKSIIALPPSAAGNCALVYNDSDDRLVFQCTSNGADKLYRLIVPVETPSYTQSTDTLQVKITMSTTSGFAWRVSDTASQIRVYYKKDNTAYNNYDREYIVQSTTSLGGTTFSTTKTSPSNHYITLSNLPTSGQEKSTSVLCVIYLWIDSSADYNDKIFFDDISVVVQ